MVELVLVFVLSIAAGGSGRFVLRRLRCTFANRIEELCFSFAVGWGTLIVLVMALGFSHLLYREAIYIALVLWAAIGSFETWYLLWWFRQDLAQLRFRWSSIYFWLILIICAGLALSLVRALAPPHGATDPLAYQLALPKIFLARHYLSFEQTITGALYPANMGLLYVVALALQNGILAQILHWLMGALCVLAVVGIGQRYFSWQVGVWAAVLFSFLPVLVFFSPQGYVDVGLCFFQLMAYWALFNWLEKSGRNDLVLAALLAGWAMGVKHQGMSTALVGATLVAAGTLAHRRGLKEGAKALLGYILLALVVVSPWYIRSYIVAGNPIWPLANRFFKGLPYEWVVVTLYGFTGRLPGEASGIWTFLPSLDRLVSSATQWWQWTFSPHGFQEAIGVYFVALLPGVLFFGRKRRLWIGCGFSVFLYLVMYLALNRNPRYSMVVFAFMSILCGWVAQQISTSGIRPLRLVFQAGMLASFLCNLSWNYWMARPLLAVAMDHDARNSFLHQYESNYRAFEYINRNLPESAVVLLQGMVKGYYCDRAYLWDHPYQALINYKHYTTPEQLAERMRELKISHILRLIRIPPSRVHLGYPQYFIDGFHEAFRRKYLRLIYRDESYVLFEVHYKG